MNTRSAKGEEITTREAWAHLNRYRVRLAESRFGRKFLRQPPVDHVENLLAIGFEHHEMPVAEDALVLQLEIFGVASRLLQESGHRRTSRPPRFFGGDVHDGD